MNTCISHNNRYNKSCERHFPFRNYLNDERIVHAAFISKDVQITWQLKELNA